MFLNSFLLVNTGTGYASVQKLYEWGLNKILSKQPSDNVDILDMHTSGNAVVCYLDGAKNITIYMINNHLVLLDKRGNDKEPRHQSQMQLRDVAHVGTKRKKLSRRQHFMTSIS